MGLLKDQSACFDPQNQLQICHDCKRNLKGATNHGIWTDFKVEIINTSQMAPGSSKVVCEGYWEKEN